MTKITKGKISERGVPHDKKKKEKKKDHTHAHARARAHPYPPYLVKLLDPTANA